MANPLLDFVMSLVRDPDAAAQYAADPAGAIQAANLTDVTSADVNALIPVVSESLSTAMPGAGADSVIGETAGNIWSSGAATSAFDAFDDHLSSVPTIDDGQSIASNVIEQPADTLHAGLDELDDAGVPSVAEFDDPSTQLTGGVIDDVPLVGDAPDTDWQSMVDDAVDQVDPGDPGFDIL